MKYPLTFLNKKIILCLFFVLFFLFAKVSFVFAGDVQVLSFTAPANNTVVPGMGADNNMIFNITFKVPVVPSGTNPKTPNDIDAIYFEGHTDTSPVHKILVFNGKKTDYSGQTKSFSFYDSSKDYSYDSFVYNFKVYDYYTKTVYKEGQLTFKSNTNYKGYYYIYKQQSPSVQTENIYSRSEKFADLLSCTNAWTTFKNQNQKAVEYKACQEYEYLPVIPNNDAYVPLDPNKSTNTNSDVYNLLAPIGELKQAPKNIGDYFNIIFKIAIGLCGALAVIMIVIGGVQYMGDESVFGKTEAKSSITKAILGLLIALGAYALLNTIDPNLLGKKGVSVAQVSAEIDSETETTPWSETETITGPTKTCTEGYSNISTYGTPATINVCNSVALNLKNMLAAAKTNGIILSGYGSRSYARQVKLRTDHNCPDIYNSSSGECKPPTARPGHSKHESGKAIDFTCSGKSIAGTNCFTWLKTNAKTYNFYNLASEPWHWSDDGH